MKKTHLSLIVFACVAMLSLCAQEKKEENPWKDAEKLFPGIKLIKLEKTEPRLMKIHIVRVDLKGKNKLRREKCSNDESFKEFFLYIAE